MGRFFARLGSGFLISIFITTMLAGGVQNAVAMLFLSIVCTAGIGLAIWVPLWWFVGMLTLDVLFRRFTNKRGRNPELAANPTELPKMDYLALTGYIGKAMASGMAPDEMTRRLQENGWQKADIESAYQSFTSYRSTTPEA